MVGCFFFSSTSYSSLCPFSLRCIDFVLHKQIIKKKSKRNKNTHRLNCHQTEKVCELMYVQRQSDVSGEHLRSNSASKLLMPLSFLSISTFTRETLEAFSRASFNSNTHDNLLFTIKKMGTLHEINKRIRTFQDFDDFIKIQ